MANIISAVKLSPDGEEYKLSGNDVLSSTYASTAAKLKSPFCIKFDETNAFTGSLYCDGKETYSCHLDMTPRTYTYLNLPRVSQANLMANNVGINDSICRSNSTNDQWKSACNPRSAYNNPGTNENVPAVYYTYGKLHKLSFELCTDPVSCFSGTVQNFIPSTTGQIMLRFAPSSQSTAVFYTTGFVGVDSNVYGVSKGNETAPFSSNNFLYGCKYLVSAGAVYWHNALINHYYDDTKNKVFWFEHFYGQMTWFE